MNKIVVYTAITGNYDSLHSVNEIDEGVDYICFTDKNFNGAVPPPWTHVRLPESKLNNKDLARYCKLNPHILVANYEKSIWIDGNIIILSKLEKLIEEVLSQHDIAAYEHWGRDTTEQEFYECARYGFDYAWRLKKQCSEYYSDGYKSTDFFENNVIFRNHNVKKIKEMHDFWWAEYVMKGKRDQYSFTYAAYKHGVEIYSLGKHDPRIVKNYFDYVMHASSRPMAQLLTIIVNRLYLAMSNWKVKRCARCDLKDGKELK